MTDAQAKELTDKITGLVDTNNTEAALLRANLLQAEAALKEATPASTVSSPTSDGSMAGSGFFPHVFQAELAKQLAELGVKSERNKSSAPKNMNDFGFSKIQIPNFSGDVREFTK